MTSSPLTESSAIVAEDSARMKYCIRCEDTKPLTEFGKNPRYRDGRQSYCKVCHQAYSRARKYGLSPEQVDEMYAAQNGGCAVCVKPIPRVGRGMHIDHCHAKDTVRALLCFQCNVALGQVEDSPARLRALANYLEEHA